MRPIESYLGRVPTSMNPQLCGVAGICKMKECA